MYIVWNIIMKNMKILEREQSIKYIKNNEVE